MFTPICWGAPEVALVGEIKIGARTKATAVGDIGDGQGRCNATKHRPYAFGRLLAKWLTSLACGVNLLVSRI